MHQLTFAATIYRSIRDRIRTQDPQIDEEAAISAPAKPMGANSPTSEGWYAISEANRLFGFDWLEPGYGRIPLRPRPRKSWRLPCGLYRPGADFGAGRRFNHHSRGSRVG
jgi:hypothetical protein